MALTDIATLKVKSPSFLHNGRIPKQYTCDGADINPELVIGQVPDGTKTLALIVDDPDAPHGTWVHWLVWDIPAQNKIAENSIPGVEGINSFHKSHYGGPCPPAGTHRYFFKVYALDTALDLDSNADKHLLENAMKGHIIAQGEIIGLYQRS